jgi:hypothetical protein
MKLTYLRELKPGRPGIAKWSVLAAVVATALIASVALTTGGAAGADPVASAKAQQTESAAVLNPAAHQMSQLNFLLGSFTCSTAPYPGFGKLPLYETTRKILNGNYYQQEDQVTFPGAGTFTAYWTLGWDPVDHNYTAQYFDNLGTTGTTTSAGWQAGHLTFAGQYVKVVTPGGVSGAGSGAKETAEDDFVIVGPGHYTDTGSVLKNGHWTAGGTDDCQKIS